MLYFVENTDNKKQFAKLIYDFFWDEEKEKLDFDGRRFKAAKGIDGWPESLDLENFEIDSAGSDHVTFVAGGDWQEMVSVSLCRHFSKNKLVFKPFEPIQNMSQTDIKKALEDLVSTAIS